MNKYISHMSALMHWNVNYSWVVFGCRTEEELSRKFRPEVSFTSRASRRNSSDCLRTHLNTTRLPRGATVRCGDSFVSSPELVFVELAPRLDFEKLVLLGLLICGHDPGRDDRIITDVKKIRTFIEKLGRVRGVDKARHAAKFLENGAASAHEAILYMLITLPHCYGGYGLAGAEFNARIDIPKEHVSVAGRKYFVADLFWRKERTVLEYDSRTHHDNESSWMKDAKKLTTLKAMGYVAESMNTAQLYGQQSLDQCMRVIAKALGHRINIRSASFERRRAKIMALLPRSSRIDSAQIASFSRANEQKTEICTKIPPSVHG